MMHWEMCSCGMTNWAVYSASSPVCVSTGTLGRRGPLSPWRVVILLVPLLPGPGHVLSPWSCVVIALGQGHGDAHPCRPQVCTEASLSPPLGGASVFSPRGRPHKVHHPRKVTVQTWATLDDRCDAKTKDPCQLNSHELQKAQDAHCTSHPVDQPSSAPREDRPTHTGRDSHENQS